jgi:hypothetical protein
MRQDINHFFILIFAVSVSLFGLFTTLMLTRYPPTMQENFLWRKPLIGSIFTLICMLGIVAVFFPKKCSQTFDFQKTERLAVSNTEDPDLHKISITLKGHHPGCGKYSAHVIHVKNHTFCAACTGLLLGALVSIAGTTLYFFGGWDIGQTAFPAVLFGGIGIVLGFIQFKFKGYARLVLNALFVFAAFLTLVGIDKFAKNTFIDLYLVFLIGFWLWTRILISQWNNWGICHTCKIPCKLKER